MQIFLYGEESFLSLKKLNEIITRFKKSDPSGINLVILDMNKAGFADFSKAVTAMPFMTKSRLIIAKNLLSQGNASLQEKILEMITDKKIPDESVVVFYENDKVDKRKKLFKVLDKLKNSHNFAKLPEFKLNKWIEAEVKSLQGEIEKAAINKLITYVGNDLWQMYNEIQKLVLYKSGKPITATDVEVLVKAKVDEEIFHLVDALGQSNMKQALKLLHDNFEQGKNEQYLLSMISFQFRNLAQVKPLLDRGENIDSIQRELKMHPFVVKKVAGQANRFSQNKIKKIYNMLVKTDLAMKTGKVDQKTALDLLIVGLCG